MTEKEKYIKFNSFRTLCLKNADDNLRAARELTGKQLNHLSFHLCILALEEIGKIFMAWIKLNQVENWDRESMNVALDDHIKKLFFAIWGPLIGKEIISTKLWQENQFMARNLHELRLLFLYGQMEDQVPSAMKVPDELLEEILSFTESRYNLATTEGEVNEDRGEAVDPLQEWFQNFLRIEGNDNYIVSPSVQAKLIELEDFNEWIKWLKEEDEKQNEALSELADNEINKSIPENFDTFTEKWELTFTLITPSHSVRKKEINSYNNSYNKYPRPYKIEAGKDKHTLKIKVTLPSVITVHILWPQAWYIAKSIAAALSIASGGIFYWHVPIDTDVFYNSIIDLESKQRLRLSVEEKLKVDWKSHGLVLTEQQMHLAYIVHVYFLHVHLKPAQREVEGYMTALGLLSRTDIHVRLEFNAFMIFFDVYQSLLFKHESIADKAEVFEIGYHQVQGMLKGRSEYDKTIKLAQDVQAKNKPFQDITMTDVLAMKMYCDIYLLTVAVRVMQNKPGIRLAPTA